MNYYEPGRFYKDRNGNMILVLENLGRALYDKSYERCFYVNRFGSIFLEALNPRLRKEI